jgi:4-azaleucine resistance transporter AzlC
LPLWPGVAAFGVVFAIVARAAGFSLLETQAFSLIVYAGSAQFAAVTLFAAGTPGVSIVLAAFLLNLRHLLYGLSLARYLAGRSRIPRALLAYLVTDETYGVAIRAFLDGRGSVLFLLGAEIGMFLCWNLATLAGSIGGLFVPDPRALGLDFIFPLSFVALIVPLLRSRRQVLVAIASGASALAISRFDAGGLTVLIPTVLGAALGAALDRAGGPTEEAA